MMRFLLLFEALFWYLCGAPAKNEETSRSTVRLGEDSQKEDEGTDGWALSQMGFVSDSSYQADSIIR